MNHRFTLPWTLVTLASIGIATNVSAGPITLVKDINPGAAGSYPAGFNVFDGRLFLAGSPFYVSDGTESGTHPLDLGLSGSLSDPYHGVEVSGGKLFFALSEGLYVTDGTAAGTQLLKSDVELDGAAACFTDLNGVLYFAAGTAGESEALWRSDGTPAGTTIVREVQLSTGVRDCIRKAGNLLFFQGIVNEDPETAGLWTSDGTTEGTSRISAVTIDEVSGLQLRWAATDDMLFFVGSGSGGAGLWRSDGTQAGTLFLNSIGTGTLFMTAAGGKVFLYDGDGVHGYELWVSDGTPEGTNVLDVATGPDTFNLEPNAVLNGTFYFLVVDPTYGSGLWKSDGTLAGTVPVKVITNPPSFVGVMAVANNRLYFEADDGVHGLELWRSDGTEDGTSLVDDLNVGSGKGFYPGTEFASVGSTLFFPATEGLYGIELYSLDVTECGNAFVDAGEDCDDGNTAGGDCCSAACAFEANGSACTDEGSVCSTDLCDGEGTCVHAPTNTGVECRSAGYESDTGLRIADAGAMAFPIAIDEHWFNTHACGDGTSIQAYPATPSPCTGWHTFTDAPASAAKIKAIADGLRLGTYTTPETTAGQTYLQYAGGSIASAITSLRALYDAKKSPDGSWTFLAPVYQDQACANPSGPLLVVGFATITIYSFTSAPDAILARVDCDVLPDGDAGAGGFGTHVIIDQECDVPEYCDGTSPTCPADEKQPAGTPCEESDPPVYGCTNDICDGGGVCTHPAASAGTECRAVAGVCDIAETCDGVTLGCPADSKRTTECRAANGGCDASEVCDGTGDACPADTYKLEGEPCRASGGICDLTEVCSGTTADCPADAYSTAECRPAQGVCDTAELCAPGQAHCPSDGKSTASCRASAGACDPAETCDGASDDCPADERSTAVCREAGGICDVAESCDGADVACPADAKRTAQCRPLAGVCDAGVEACDGVSDDCPADAMRSAGTVCRASAGTCDSAETCTGTSADCPVDAFIAASTACRDAAGVCDTTESCTGTSAECPADSFASTAVVCRDSSGVCDEFETCTGADAACPADAFASAGLACRDAAGICDLVESCTGSDGGCPADVFVSAGTYCRGSAGVCDLEETCTGADPHCPADTMSLPGAPCGNPTVSACSGADTCDASGTCSANDLPAGAACDDGDVCTTGDACLADGECSPGEVPACDDGNPCTVDTCAPDSGDCSFEVRPAAGCRVGGKSGLGIATRGDGKARWKWGRGAETSCEDFGAPDVDTSYDVCIYDGIGGGDYILASHFALPASGLWESGKSCRWTYEDSSGSSDGITSVRLTPHEEGRASIQFGAAGNASPIPVPVAADRFMSMDPNVTVQIHNSLGLCWESEFTTARKNSGEKFKTTRLILVGGLDKP